MWQVSAMPMTTMPLEEEKEKRLEAAFAELRAKLAKIPPDELYRLSPELKSLIGILPSDVDVKKEYYEYIERKHR